MVAVESIEIGKDLTPGLCPMACSLHDSVDDGDFINAKESKKSRKKAAKAKAAGAKVSVPVAATEIPASSSPNEKGNRSRQALQERELLPAVPSGLSLGDFVVWKGEAAAWSTDSGKAAKGASLRDILKEQEKKVSSGQHQTPMPASKTSAPQFTRGNGSSWSSSMSSPAKAASTIQITSHGSSQSNNKVDDDLFWGPVTDSQSDSVDDGDFINAKESKKSRKKAAKAKAAGAKVSVAATEIPASSSPNEKGNRSRQALQERELLPAVPSGPSLGDFVVWKGEAAAWSTDSGKAAKGASLRDILKEQEKKVSSSQHQTPMPASKTSAPQSTRGNGSSWSSSMSSPAKAASAIQITSHGSSQSINKVDDDLFWGPVTDSQSDSVDDGDFINAKESKKGRKKAAKAKAAGAKVSVPVAATEIPASSSPNEKGNRSRQALQERELLPAVPSGPSLGDFVVWKGEAAAWSTDSGKAAKGVSLRDILKVQEKKVSSGQHQTPMPASKTSAPQSTRGNGSSWSSSMSSPAKAASAIQITSHGSSQSNNKVDDDLFWGPVEHSKQETKQSDFPQLANQGGWGKKALVKGFSGQTTSSSSALKGKRDVLTKQSEAMGFRNWCENECVRLMGSKDTSFLEFCLKQSRSEAEILLKENLGSIDRDYAFIDKFLYYKDFLPSNVLKMAFQSGGDYKVSGDANAELGSNNADGGPIKVVGKKKGK